MHWGLQVPINQSEAAWEQLAISDLTELPTSRTLAEFRQAATMFINPGKTND
jgi:hypothetical protein